MAFQSVAASPGMAVAVGGSVISVSADAATFTDQPPLPATFLSRVRWTGASFVTVGTAGALLTSPDGLAWTSRDAGTTADVLDVAGAPARTVIAAPDGDAWTVETTMASTNILGFASSGPTVVAFADQGRIYASTTPGAWVERQAPWGYPTNSGIWDGLRFVGIMDAAQIIASP